MGNSNKNGGHYPRTSLVLLTSAVAALLVLSLSDSASPATAQRVERNEKVQPNQDAKSYATSYGVSVGEALRRLKLQNGPVGNRASELEAKLMVKEPDTFAGLYVQHEPRFRFVVLVTRGGEEKIRPYIEDFSLTSLVEVRAAKITLARLESAQAKAVRATEEADVAAESFVDVIDNSVKLRVTDRERLGIALGKTQGMGRETSGVSVPEHVEVVEVDELLKPTGRIFGGALLRHNRYYWCTSGFSVRHRDGRRGITTAGHCVPNPRRGDYRQLYFRGNKVFLQGYGRYYGPYDVQWHTTPGLRDIPYFWDGYRYRPVRYTKARGYQKINDYVCKYGRSAGYGCGRIKGKTFNRVSSPNTSSTFIYVRRARGTSCLIKVGDSGGPWFNYHTALGIQSAGNCNEAAYMAINYVHRLGLNVIKKRG